MLKLSHPPPVNHTSISSGTSTNGEQATHLLYLLKLSVFAKFVTNRSYVVEIGIALSAVLRAQTSATYAFIFHLSFLPYFFMGGEHQGSAEVRDAFE